MTSSAVLDEGLCQSQRVSACGVLKKAIVSALSERDETADICTDDEGCPEADPELRDTENVPLAEDVMTLLRAGGQAARPRRLGQHRCP